MVVKPLPPTPRPHALADLERAVTEAEASMARSRAALARLAPGHPDHRRLAGLLRVKEAYLARLQQSRRVLLEGESGEDHQDEEMPTG